MPLGPLRTNLSRSEGIIALPGWSSGGNETSFRLSTASASLGFDFPVPTLTTTYLGLLISTQPSGREASPAQLVNDPVSILDDVSYDYGVISSRLVAFQILNIFKPFKYEVCLLGIGGRLRRECFA